MLYNKIKKIKKLKSTRKSIIKNVAAYNIYINIYNIYKYMEAVNNNIFIFNNVNKKNILYYLNNTKAFNPLVYEPMIWYLTNANISILGNNYKRYKMLAFIRKRYVRYPLKRITSNFAPVAPIINKSRFIRFFISWYMSINKKESKAYNLNNIIAYCYDLQFFKQSLEYSYFILRVKINKLKSNKKKRLLIKNYLKQQRFYLKFFRAFDMMFKKILNVTNIVNIKYSNFSFKLRSKKKKANKYYALKRYNMLFYINNIISKFFYYVFLYWINIYMAINNNNKLLFSNYIKSSKSSYFILINMYKNYFYARGRKKYKKVVYLNNFKNNRLVIYFKTVMWG